MHADTPHSFGVERYGSADLSWVLRCDACSETCTTSDGREALALVSETAIREGCPGEPEVVSPYRLAELRPGVRVRLEPTTHMYTRGGVQVFEKATQPTVVGTVVEASADYVVIIPSERIYGSPALSVQEGGPTEAFTVSAEEISHSTDSPWHTLYSWSC